MQAPATLSLLTEVRAPATGAKAWHTVDFISDLHLQASEPQTAQAWRDYLARTTADAIFILGDLFEVWVGDDGLDETGNADAEFDASCIKALHEASAKHALYFLHGNRDFLFGAQAAQRAGLTLLADPATLSFGGQRWLLSHGDALCLDDKEYQLFRAQARSAAWQQRLLAQPLAQRRVFAKSLRQQSEAQKQSGEVTYADADPVMTRAWLQAANAATLIHGHTHKPATHDAGQGPNSDMKRHVLSDWHLDGERPRAEVLRLTLDDAKHAHLQRLPLPQI